MSVTDRLRLIYLQLFENLSTICVKPQPSMRKTVSFILLLASLCLFTPSDSLAARVGKLSGGIYYDSNDNNEKYRNVANATTTMLQSGVSKKGSTTTKNKAINISAAIATTTDVTTNLEERKTRMLLELENMVAKNATTTMPGINNAATMTGTPIAATLTSGSVAEHDSSGSVAMHDTCHTNKGNKNVSIMSDLFFRKLN
jgi:hypothetical protein